MMMEEQNFADPTPTGEDPERYTFHKILVVLKPFLKVAGFAIASIFLVLLISIILNPYHLLHVVGILPRLIELIAHPAYLLYFWFMLTCIVVFAFFLIIWLAREPISIVAYLQYVKRTQERYFEVYTPLKALPDVYRTPVTHISEESGDAPLSQEIDILNLAQQKDRHLLLLGLPGAGKTMFLRYYQYTLLQQNTLLRQTWGMLFGNKKVPVFVPMKDYSLYVDELGMAFFERESPLLDFLYAREQGIGYIRHCLKKLKKQGRLMFLCDGINEVDSNSLTWICNELIDLMRQSRNQLVMTCRELDYTVEQDIQRLVTEGEAARALIHRLQPDAIKAFVTKYVEKQGDKWSHSADLIYQRIESTRLSIHCANPFMLFTFMEIIDRVGIDGQDPLDTRGLLLQEYTSQLIDMELNEEKWRLAEFSKEDVLQFLSEVACAARWANDRNAIYLSPSLGRNMNSPRKDITDGEAARDLLHWLDDNLAQGPLAGDSNPEFEQFHNNLDSEKLTGLLQFAKAVELIVATSYNRVLSFRHELIAEYFVARYFHAVNSRQSSILPLRKELLDNVGKWSEPVALWAGLINNPLHLADRIAQLGQQDQDAVTEALMLSLVCISVEWHPPQNNVNRPIELPQRVKENLAKVVQHAGDRERVAELFDRCAAEGGVEVYHALLPLLSIQGIDRLMVLLNTKVVPELLFRHLENSVNSVHFQMHVEPLVSILGEFGRKIGNEVITRARELSQDVPRRNALLRIAAVRILGKTEDQRAVEALMALWSDAQHDIVKASLASLVHLGPNLVLEPTLQKLMNYAQTTSTYKRHKAALELLFTFLKESDVQRQLKDVQYQRVIEVIITVLSSNFMPQIQGYARIILIDQGKDIGRTDSRREQVVKLLLPQLTSLDSDMGNNIVLALKEIGEYATPYLIEQLKRQPADIVRVRIIDVFGYVHDPRALEIILSLVADRSQEIFYRVKLALHHYSQQSECIPGVINLILYNSQDYVADRAAEILEGFGEIAVGSVIQALPHIVYGRTQLLVRVLENIHDADAVFALIALLEMPQVRNDISLALAVVHALGQFRDERVVSPLIRVVGSSDIRLYEEAIESLSFLGEVAFDSLIAALNVEPEMVATPRIRKALLNMDPFPGERLFNVFTNCDDILAQQIRIVFHEKGFPAAQLLLQHLFYPDIRVQGDVRRTLYAMDRTAVIPAFLEKLNRRPTPEFLDDARQYLKQYDESIPPLVSFLSNPEKSDAATTILLDIGPRIFPSMVNGLNDPGARIRSQHIVKKLGLQQPEVFPNIIELFALIASKRQQQQAREALLELLTEDHADVIIPYLLQALETAELVGDITDALLILARRDETKGAVLEGLMRALERDGRRKGAEKALVRFEDLAVNPVSELIAHPDLAVDEAAQRILMKIGVPAFPVIWSLHSDTRNPRRQAAAQKILYAMPTEVIKDKLVELLSSDEAKNIEMALTLLLELIQNENMRPPGSQAMIPALLTYIQKGGEERMSLRIIALLLLLNRSNVVDYMIQALRDNSQHDERMVQAFLLLKRETAGEALQKVLLDANGKISPKLRAELTGVLGMIKAYPVVDSYARSGGVYGLSAGGGGRINDSDSLAISLRALGGLLASGRWNIETLRNLRSRYEEGRSERELFDILLGDLYSPRLAAINIQLQSEQAAHNENVQNLMAQVQNQQTEIQRLNNELQLKERQLVTKQTEMDNLKWEKQQLQNQLDQRSGNPYQDFGN